MGIYWNTTTDDTPEPIVCDGCGLDTDQVESFRDLALCETCALSPDDVFADHEALKIDRAYEAARERCAEIGAGQ